MARKIPKRLLTVGALILAGAAGMFLIPVSMARTSTSEYCLSCHEMKGHSEELKKSSHALDRDKKPIECAQCHIPVSVGPKYVTVKTVLGLKDMFVHYLGNPERLDRRGMQNVARRFVPDENCLACHRDLYKNAKDKKISEIGRLCHEAYLGINGATKRNCAGCHFNMAHLPAFDRRYLFNAEFAKRLPIEKKEERL